MKKGANGDIEVNEVETFTVTNPFAFGQAVGVGTVNETPF